MMKRTISTHQLLTLGMALYADKRGMEQRVRGIFGRARTAGFARALTLLLCFVVFAGCFTTACMPVRETTAGMDAATDRPIPSLDTETEAQDDAAAYEQYSESQQILHTENRKHVAPRVGNSIRKQRGDWSVDETVSETEAQKAIAAMLPVCNALFDQNYEAEQMHAVYYRDGFGNRPNIWRITSDDDVLVAAIHAETLELISADCIRQPGETLHESIPGQLNDLGSGDHVGSLDLESIVQRLTEILGGTAVSTVFRGGLVRSQKDANRGWQVQKTMAAALEDGRYYLANYFGDEALTLDAVGICPDYACMLEGVYWRADLEMTAQVSVLVNPPDFRKGKPGEGDMTEQAVYDFYKKLVAAANGESYVERGGLIEPNLTFYEDHSGARENYWHVEGNVEGGPLIFNIAAKSGHIFQLYADRSLGFDMDLTGISYERMGGEEYLSATKKLFELLFGAGSVTDVNTNAVYDWHYCTVDPVMRNGTAYEVLYEDGLIHEITFYSSMKGDMFGTDPNWAADWLYINTETGETFHEEW